MCCYLHTLRPEVIFRVERVLDFRTPEKEQAVEVKSHIFAVVTLLYGT